MKEAKHKTRSLHQQVATTGFRAAALLLIVFAVGGLLFLSSSPLLAQEPGPEPPTPETLISIFLSGTPALTADLGGVRTDPNVDFEWTTLQHSGPTGKTTTFIASFVTATEAQDGIEVHITLPTEKWLSNDWASGYHDTLLEPDLEVDLYAASGNFPRSCTDSEAQISILEVEGVKNTITRAAIDFQHACASDDGSMTVGAIRLNSAMPVDNGRTITGIVYAPAPDDAPDDAPRGVPLEGVVVCARSEGQDPVFFAPGCTRTGADGQYLIEPPVLASNPGDRWFLSIYDQRNPIYRFSCIPAARDCGSALFDLTGPVRTNRNIETSLEIGCLLSAPTITADVSKLPKPATNTGTDDDKVTVLGTEGADVIVAYGGNVRVEALGGNDTICVGNGTNTILGGEGNDRILGGIGFDTIRGEGGNDTIAGNDGDDEIAGGFDDDSLLGQSGNDTIDGGPGNDAINGGDGDDMIEGADDNDTVFGGPGNDVIDGSDGRDELHGGSGDDIMNGGDLPDQIFGDAGDDTINGSDGADVIFGGAGSDTLDGGKLSDSLCGGERLLVPAPDQDETGTGGSDEALCVDSEVPNFDDDVCIGGSPTEFEVENQLGGGGDSVSLCECYREVELIDPNLSDKERLAAELCGQEEDAP